MAKKLKKRSSITKNIDDYGTGDSLLELLRAYYKSKGMWVGIVAKDKELQRRNKQKEINNIRRYK